tara:strand:+ start:2453 stop:3043 length:591 start_codon:yes stop_codon:yes gene_type:complete
LRKDFLINFKKFIVFLISIIIITFVWWLILIFNTFPKKFYVNADSFESSKSVIVVLTGGKGRIDKGLELFESNYGKYLFISGVFKESEIKINIFVENKLIEKDCCVIVDNKSKNTFENAFEVKRWLNEKNDIKNLILVSSYYHLPRSYIVFKKLIKDKDILLSPVNYKINFNKNIIFHVRLIILEYFKIIYTLFSL